MKRFGLLGCPVAQSYSPFLHSSFSGMEYELFSVPPEDLDAFMRAKAFDGLNVTIPYKRAVLPYLDELSENARQIGSVNTILHRKDGTLFGDNTDLYGMEALLHRISADVRGKKVLILGSGGTSRTACCAVKKAGGLPVVISRGDPVNHYGNLRIHSDAAYLINTTPVGMTPEEERQPVDLAEFPHLRGVIDAVFHPLKTRLILQAEDLKLPCAGGLEMLAVQAARANSLFTGKEITQDRLTEVLAGLRRKVTNLVLIGMPGAGKSTIAKMLAQRLEMPSVSSDEEIEKETGMTISEIFRQKGEAFFRQKEKEVLARVCRKGRQIIDTGGGCILDETNRANLRMNGFVVLLTRPLDRLATENRPLSGNTTVLEKLWKERGPFYSLAAEAIVHNDRTPEECAESVREKYDEAVDFERAQSEYARHS